MKTFLKICIAAIMLLATVASATAHYSYYPTHGGYGSYYGGGGWYYPNYHQPVGYYGYGYRTPYYQPYNRPYYHSYWPYNYRVYHRWYP